MILEILVTAAVAFFVGHSVGSPKTVEKDVERHIHTDTAHISGSSGARAGSGRVDIKSVEADSVSMNGATGARSSGAINTDK